MLSTVSLRLAVATKFVIIDVRAMLESLRGTNVLHSLVAPTIIMPESLVVVTFSRYTHKFLEIVRHERVRCYNSVLSVSQGAAHSIVLPCITIVCLVDGGCRQQ